MLLMGSDFQYTNANSWYINLDKLIKYVNEDVSNRAFVPFPTTPSLAVQESKSDIFHASLLYSSSSREISKVIW